MSKLSIITINYNDLEGLKKTVNSVIGQTYPPFEYIVIDGASTDGSAAYIESQTANINHWISENDSGVYNAMNKGIKAATGDYLFFLNSGDVLNDATTLEKLNNESLGSKDIIACDICLDYIESSELRSCPEKITFDYLHQYAIPHQALLLKRELFEKVGLYDENLKLVSDWKFVLKALSFYSATYKKINIVLCKYDMNGISSIAANKELLRLEKEAVLNADYGFFMEDYNRFNVINNKFKGLANSRILRFLIKCGLFNKKYIEY
ncbi:glycosyltransferase family 2 protein [Flavobacterium sp. GT3R68]|uniref:glycosyltransferase family 2 protein n=1 Tax=Flavobacterium sp. GT3R68 TaxID=2594437 RepID=UPI0013152BE5|nr:glycosyltransferase family 2 protein [Flavobacterium sp. GT3R68]